MGPQIVAFVLDNSVIVGWFISSQASAYTRRCNRRARREAVHVPALWETEFANVMLALVKRKVIARHHAEQAFHHAARLPLTIDREPVSPGSLFALGERYGVSAYDASYLELAQRLNVPLATRDARLQAAGKAAAVLLS